MSDYDIHSCGYYCDRPVCIIAQRDELRDKLFSDQAVKTYSGGKPNYTQPIVRITTLEDIAKIKSKWEPTIDGWPLWSGLPEPEPVAYINVEERELEWATPIKWETPTVVKMDKVPLYTAPPQQNEFNPDWDAMAVMVEEQQRMAKRIEELTQLVTNQGIRLMDAEARAECDGGQCGIEDKENG